MTTNGSASYFSDLSLARRLDRAEGHSAAKFVEARARFFPHIGSSWTEVAGAYALYDGANSPVTQTFGLGLFEPIGSTELDQIERFFDDRRAPANHDVSPLAGLALASLLSGRGYRPIEFSSVMYMPMPKDLSKTHNNKLQVRPIGDDEGELWARIAAKGWDTPEFTGLLLELAPICTRREDSVSFLAELEGKPIGAGTLCLHQGVALLAGACTIPEGRRQGAQLALLDARLRFGAAQGCDLAMMCAEPGSTSQRNAERHGFRIAYTRTKWQRKQPNA